MYKNYWLSYRPDGEKEEQTMYRVGTQIIYKGYTLRKTSKTNWNMKKGETFGYAPSLKKAKELIDKK